MERRPANTAIFGRRVVAALIDIVLWTGILVLAALRFGTRSVGPGGVGIAFVGTPFLVYVLCAFAYFILFEWLGGATLGKLALGLRVAGPNGQPISLPQSLLRNLLRAVDGLPYLVPYALGLVVVSASPKKQRLGDIVAHTHVIKRAGATVAERS